MSQNMSPVQMRDLADRYEADAAKARVMADEKDEVARTLRERADQAESDQAWEESTR